MRLIVAATPSVAIPTLEAIIDSHHELVSVITQPDRPSGRGRELRSSPVSQWAHAKGITIVKPEDSSEMTSILKDIDCVITIGYGVILPAELLSIPKHGFLNLHFSLLPKWRGAAPVQRAIEAGDPVTGVTVFRLDAGMDTGPIYLKCEIPLDPSWDSATAFEELAHLGAPAVLETLSLLESGVEPTPQSDQGATKARKLTTFEAEIDWSRAADEILRKIKAFTPSPGAWTKFRNVTLKISEAAAADVSEALQTGEISLEHGSVLVGTGKGAIDIIQVTPAGKGSMPAPDWARGARIENGAHFG